MSKAAWWFVFSLSIGISLFGDAAMKRAGVGPSWRWFAAGFTAYSMTSFGWFVLLRDRSLVTVGTLYPVANAIGLTILGMAIFHEHVGPREIAGIVFGIASMVLLGGG